MTANSCMPPVEMCVKDAPPPHSLAEFLQAEISALSNAALPLVGALVSMQPCLPKVLTDYVMQCLSQRCNVSVVSPAAEAVMRMAAFASIKDQEFATRELHDQFLLLSALQQTAHLNAAIGFMNRMAEYLEQVARKKGP